MRAMPFREYVRWLSRREPARIERAADAHLSSASDHARAARPADAGRRFREAAVLFRLARKADLARYCRRQADAYGRRA